MKFGELDVGARFVVDYDIFIKIYPVVDYDNANKKYNCVVLYSPNGFYYVGGCYFIEDDMEVKVI